MGDENPIRTLGDYSRPSHEGYRNTIELPEGNNVVPLRSDTIRLVQNGCSFHGLRSEDPNQHLKDFLKLVDSLDLDGENRERTRLRLFQFSLRDQASNWLERLPAGSISTWEDLTTRFLAQFFPPGRTAKLRNDILMFQQHHGESLSEAWTRFKDLLQKVPHHGIDLWLQSLYDNDSWNDPMDFAKPVKAIALPQDVPSTSVRRLIELKNQVQRLMETYLALTQPTQVNKITTPCEIYSGPHDTQCCMENPKESYVEYTSSRTDEAGDARLSKFESDFKQQQSEMTNKIDTVLKAITDRIAGILPSDTVKNLKLGTHPVSSAHSYLTMDPQCSTKIHGLINTITIHPKQPKESQVNRSEVDLEEDNSRDTNSNPHPQPNPFASIATEQVRKLNSMLKSLGLVPQSSNTKFICPKEDDGEVMFIEIIRDDEPQNEDPHEVEGATTEEPVVEYFDTFLTRDELTYHRYLMSGPIPSIFLRNPIIRHTYIDLKSPTNIMSRRQYNQIMTYGLKPRLKSSNPNKTCNFVGRVKGLKVFIGSFAYECDFMILEDTTSIIDNHLREMVFGKPFIEETGLVYNEEEGTAIFEHDDEKITFKMPHTMKIFEQTRLMGLSIDSIPPSAYEDNFGHGRTHYYQSLLLGDEYKQDKGDRRGIRHLMRLEKEVMDNKGEVT
ncbi:MAK10-like protein [Tanacetum coccineum]|uniref:MAK10-like protein n=1 Tax=Tanacetum coccineum TaxID=301880 RepID=A0ABQ4WG11_9ASTR